MSEMVSEWRVDYDARNDISQKNRHIDEAREERVDVSEFLQLQVSKICQKQKYNNNSSFLVRG